MGFVLKMALAISHYSCVFSKYSNWQMKTQFQNNVLHLNQKIHHSRIRTFGYGYGI